MFSLIYPAFPFHSVRQADGWLGGWFWLSLLSLLEAELLTPGLGRAARALGAPLEPTGAGPR